MGDPTRRFSNRVDDYVRYRPGYPDAVLDFLGAEIGTAPEWDVADIGSGTGILTRMLLDRGHRVYAVEPNDDMRAAAERDLAGREGFHSVKGTAEETALEDGCVDMALAAQAFHWFDVPRARAECRRILRGEGWVALLWNTRVLDANPFMVDYERLLIERGADYTTVDHRQVGADKFGAFFEDYRTEKFRWVDPLDHERCLGRMMSASYVPPYEDPRNPHIVEGLRGIFDTHARDGRVEWVFDAELTYGRAR